MSWEVVALYRFMPLADLPDLKIRAEEVCRAQGICGTILLAPEGINGTVGAPGPDALRILMAFLEETFGINNGEVKFSTAREKPFHRMKVRLKKEIVSLRAPGVNPARQAGTYVEAGEWNALLQDPDIVLIDTRNSFEVEAGRFPGALDPGTTCFHEFPRFVKNRLDPARDKKIAMYCTGGIRCEKASSYLLAQGFDEVYHLKGGILKYLETVPEEQSLWQGTCFVFDRRHGLTHGLKEDYIPGNRPYTPPEERG